MPDLKGWVKGKVRAAQERRKEQARIEAEIGAVARQAELEAYKRERLKQAKIRGRARGRMRARGGGGGFLSTLGSIGQKAQKAQKEMFEVPNLSMDFDLFGSQKKRQSRKREKKRKLR